MKLFLAFASDWYYPAGAEIDFVGAYDTFEEACAAALAKNRDFEEVYNVAEEKWLEVKPLPAS
jgi:hypothetical protein